MCSRPHRPRVGAFGADRAHAEAGSAGVGFRETICGGMNPPLRKALGRASRFGAIWGVWWMLFHWQGDAIPKTFGIGAAVGVISFGLTFCLAYFFPTLGQRRRQSP